MATYNPEAVTYWRGVKSALTQRGLLHQYRKTESGGREPVLPETHYMVDADKIAFVLDMNRLGGIPREAWLDPELHAQIRATLQGRRVYAADSAGIALVVARNPDAPRVRLPARVTLSPDLVPDGDYTACLGLSARGPVIFDLADGERSILAGGTTGTGKTGTIRGLVLQLAHKCGPDRLHLALVDLKRLDFTALAGLPHLVGLATQEVEAADLVGHCLGEMERRLAVMQSKQVTRWDYMPDGERFPLLLVVVDECADFGDSAVMADLVQLARKGRAAGIALILATQRPDAQVLNRQVKANVSTRLAFRVTDGTESRIILDRNGAEKLTRPGLALTNAGGRWRKVQCVYVPDDCIGDWTATATARPALSEIERALVKFAVENLDGAFTIGRLYDAMGAEDLTGTGTRAGGRACAGAGARARVSKRRLTALGQSWEQRGWLTEPVDAVSSRFVTPELAALAGCTLDGKNGDAVTGMIGGDARLQAAVIGNEGDDRRLPGGDTRLPGTVTGDRRGDTLADPARDDDPLADVDGALAPLAYGLYKPAVGGLQRVIPS